MDLGILISIYALAPCAHPPLAPTPFGVPGQPISPAIPLPKFLGQIKPCRGWENFVTAKSTTKRTKISTPQKLSAIRYKTRQTEFALYRHHPDGFSDFLKKFQISDCIRQLLWNFGPAPSSTAIEGRDLDDREFEPGISRTLLLV